MHNNVNVFNATEACLKMVKIVNFTLCAFYYGRKREERRKIWREGVGRGRKEGEVREGKRKEGGKRDKRRREEKGRKKGGKEGRKETALSDFSDYDLSLCH